MPEVGAVITRTPALSPVGRARNRPITKAARQVQGNAAPLSVTVKAAQPLGGQFAGAAEQATFPHDLVAMTHQIIAVSTSPQVDIKMSNNAMALPGPSFLLITQYPHGKDDEPDHEHYDQAHGNNEW